MAAEIDRRLREAYGLLTTTAAEVVEDEEVPVAEGEEVLVSE